MLTLSRRPSERIILEFTEDMPKGTRITIVMLRMQGRQAHFGISAPPAIEIDREEIFLRKHPQLVGQEY